MALYLQGQCYSQSTTTASRIAVITVGSRPANHGQRDNVNFNHMAEKAYTWGRGWAPLSWCAWGLGAGVQDSEENVIENLVSPLLPLRRW